MKRHYLTIFILSILFIFNSFQSNGQGISLIQQRKLINALNIISNMYVDSVNDKKLVETAIVAMLKELDPHSVYIPKEEVERINEPLE
ncbi:MAG TPA: peptidase S41, partial [Paludibacteraceae bacterium]|nr:peptidase S41 [Paludibacteraceae bacterium]